MTLDFALPYSSRRAPVFAKNLVACANPLASEAGIYMLRQGGNAIDAALAAAITLIVVEPMGSTLGGDAFAIVLDGKTLQGLNASGRSPFSWDLENFKQYTTMPTHGWTSVTMPGVVSGWVKLSKTFGKLPFEKLFEPAIHYANEGYLLTPVVAKQWVASLMRFSNYPDFLKTFLIDGKTPKIGQLIKLPFLAKTLQEIAQTQGESFYQGKIAQAILAHSHATGGKLTEKDFTEHTADWVKPLAQTYRN